MAKFHVNPTTGEAGKCSAQKGNCPFGGEENHFTSLEAARAAYEEQQTNTNEEFSQVDKALKEFSKDSNVFRSWGTIHADFKTTSDGKRLVMVGTSRGSVLAPWLGPKPLERYEAMSKKLEIFDAQQKLAEEPPSSFAGYSPTINAMDLNDLRPGDRFYDIYGTAYSLESWREGSYATLNPLDEKGDPLGTPGQGVIRVGEGKNPPEKFFKLKKIELKNYVDQRVGGQSESKAVKPLPAAGNYEKAVSGQVQYFDENGKPQTIELIAPTARLTDKARISLGRQLWAFTGKDPARYEDASDEQKLHWANQHIMRRKNFNWTTKDGAIRYSHDMGGGIRNEGSIKLVDLG